MKTAINILLKLIIPAVIIFVAFVYLGILGGLLAAVLYFAVFNFSGIIQNIAGRKYASGDYDGALKLLERAIRINPRNYRARGTYAYLLLKMGRTEDADVQIDQAIANCISGIDKNSLAVTKSLVLWKRGNIDNAIEILENTIKNYKNTNVYGTLGFMYIEKGDLEKALSFNLEAYEYNNTNAIILDNLGYTRYLRHEYDEALAVYEQVMKLKPNFPVAFYNYALVLEHFGRFDDAAYMCRYALSMKFWSISAISREEVEKKLHELEAAIREQEEDKERKSGDSGSESINPEQPADIK